MKHFRVYPKIVGDQESLDIIYEQDGNPDFVISYGLDCYESGKAKGLIVGSAIAITIFLSTAIIAKSIKRRKEKERRNP